MKILGIETVPGVWKKTTTWLIALLTAMWGGVLIAWSQADAQTQQEVLSDFGLAGQSSGKLFFYFTALSLAINAALLFLRTTKLPWEPDAPAVPTPVQTVVKG